MAIRNSHTRLAINCRLPHGPTMENVIIAHEMRIYEKEMLLKIQSLSVLDLGQQEHTSCPEVFAAFHTQR